MALFRPARAVRRPRVFRDSGLRHQQAVSHLSGARFQYPRAGRRRRGGLRMVPGARCTDPRPATSIWLRRSHWRRSRGRHWRLQTEAANPLGAKPSDRNHRGCRKHPFLAARPESRPRQTEWFQLRAMALRAVLAGYAKTVNEQWPELLATKYHVLALQFDRKAYPGNRHFATLGTPSTRIFSTAPSGPCRTPRMGAHRSDRRLRLDRG